ncbi:hypothetical protein [Thomasclavelia sp.]
MNKNKIMIDCSNNNEGIIKVKDIIDYGNSKQHCLELKKLIINESLEDCMFFLICE